MKNIEDTEKAKRVLNETKGERKPQNPEAHLVATRCTPILFLVLQHINWDAVYQPNLKQKSDADIMRDAKMEAMGLRPEDHEPPKRKQNRMATDDMVSSDNSTMSWCSVMFLGDGAVQEAHAEVRPHFFGSTLTRGRYLSLGPVFVPSPTAIWELQKL